MEKFKLSYRPLPVYSLAAQQNAYKLFSDIKVLYQGDEEEDSSDVLRNLRLELRCEDDVLENQVWPIGQLVIGQHMRLQDRTLQFAQNFLRNLSDETSLKFTFTLFDEENPDSPLLTHKDTLVVLPANFWGGEERQPELLAAFVKPNGVYVESLVKQVTEVMEDNGHERSADGYQSNTREKPYLMAAVLWKVVAAQKIAYVPPPPSFAHKGQLVRLASDISNNPMAACLDLSLLFASCLELMGLNTVIVLGKEHAFVGVWLIKKVFPFLTNDDPMELRKRVDARDLILFESTMVTNASRPTFEQSCSHARDLIDEKNEADFVYAIDIGQARILKVKPMSTIEDRRDETTAEEEGNFDLPVIPPLPPVRANEKVIEETPATRIETWQRRLLDLTKRNPLLSFKERSTGIRIFCPDIGRMEDRLAAGTFFSFVSSEKSSINDRERSRDKFRLLTGEDLHKNYALGQLEENTLVADMAQKQLENTSVNLLRKAKNDLEEGGANTLFLALGMLRWKEHSKDDRSFKAPLILIPVELSRKSARAKVKLRQLADEDPIFNLTLIEFLSQVYEIDLNHLRENLPEDDSGVDVTQIWQDVRDAVSEQEGFEVVEECVVASFSFAKYLMWKDLKDRIGDLKENLFVAHLVDRPQDAYYQDTHFIKQNEVDQKIDPADIFVPLNCDSSQLAAVEASSRSQDFVLEGPPGTGKSETIANMIVNNLAKGRKVLFVAEKIAALQVVYSRIKKIHLDHLCLELHSNKANKVAVLNQLRSAANKRNSTSVEEWKSAANRLRGRRDELNTYITALHAPSEFGISAQSAISRVLLYKDKHQFELGWSDDIEDAPVRGGEGLEELLEAARKAGSVYSDIADLDVTPFKNVQALSWSFSWQTRILNGMQEFIDHQSDLSEAVAEFGSQFGVKLQDPDKNQLECLKSLSLLTDLAESQPLSYAIGRDVRDRLQRLKSLAEAKGNLDDKLTDIGHEITAERLAQTPIDDWVKSERVASESWWRRLFIKRKINKAAKELGYPKFSDLSVLTQIKSAKLVHDKISELVKEFSRDNIWGGWDTSPEHLRERYSDGERAYAYVRQSVGLADDPMTVLMAIETKLVDGREFLVDSKVYTTKRRFNDALAQFRESSSTLDSVHVELPENQGLSQTVAYFKSIIKNQNKLKNWVDWVEARNQAESLKLGRLCAGLESGQIRSEDAKDQVRTAFCSWLAPRLIDAKDILRKFKAKEHEYLIEQFRYLDKEVADTTSDYVTALIAQTAPDISSKENSKHFGTLSRELQKKTRHKPVRALFQDMGERLLDLCPCMMMSPLSVAQFLPSDFNAFDVVIFDEASQIPTWDAVGAIARGKNVIVVGDPKQLPPTNFFNSTIAADDADEEDLESILDQALVARLSQLSLMGHYRSRHESLIAFSNNKYYNNSLVTYPSSDTKKSAVTLCRLDGVYTKGTGRNNPIEAKAIVDEVVKRLTDSELSKHTLGIVTLNTEQQRTIEDLLDEARYKHPEIEKFFHGSDDYDPVFVKNLESVQGDERDVIMLSLGYGPTDPGGKTMSMNFGPLNKKGGERRLNVAVTRATTEMVVFVSFDSSMIDLTRTSATGVEHLKHYLEFAERGPVALAEQSTAAYGVDQFDSDFEQAVARALRERHWKVQSQVGVSKFRIDLGIVHPDFPGRYLAGVECDGARYHGSPSARDRDRVRQAVLENLGWRLVRLWSTDYFRDPDAAIEKLDDRLNKILEQDQSRALEEEAGAEAKIEASSEAGAEIEAGTELELEIESETELELELGRGAKIESETGSDIEAE